MGFTDFMSCTIASPTWKISKDLDALKATKNLTMFACSNIKKFLDQYGIKMTDIHLSIVAQHVQQLEINFFRAWMSTWLLELLAWYSSLSIADIIRNRYGEMVSGKMPPGKKPLKNCLTRFLLLLTLSYICSFSNFL